MLLSIEAQLCTRNVSHVLCALQLKKAFVVETFCTLYVCTAVLQCSTTFVLKLSTDDGMICLLTFQLLNLYGVLGINTS